MSETPKEAAKRLAGPMLDKGFKPVALHAYTDPDGNPIFWRMRCKHPETGEKWIRPMKMNGQGYELAEPKFTGGKPLYGLHHIASNPAATVWIVEGEQKADALNGLGLVATTSGAATSAASADWKPLRGRTVRIWPDNDDAGKGYAGEVASILLGMGCAVSCVDVGKLALGIGDDAMEWLAAHPGATGGDIEALPMLEPSLAEKNGNAQAGDSDEPISRIPDETERPCFHVFDDEVETENEKYRPGVWHFGIKPGKDDSPPTLTKTWICSPLHVEAVTYDAQDNNFGRLLRFINTNGHSRDWAMPMELLKADGNDLRGELLAMGVHIDPAGHRLLGQYLQAKTPERRINCALQVGWCGDSFVLPDIVIGPKATEIIFQSGERGHDEFTRGGTLDGWKSEIAALADGNPLLMQALSASFAGPLLAKCNAEGGGLHLVGDSSTGKTTIIEAACSIWGGSNYKRSWRATANGMEGAAALSNDGLLAVDEINECDAREVGAIVYALSNGRGKQRASRTGSARSVTRWRCVVLSSGECTIATKMLEGGYRAKPGQAVRLLDIPTARTYGAWDDLHGLPTGAVFADVLKKSVATHYGHAGRAFLEKLTRDTRNFSDSLERIKALPAFAAKDGEGQDKRAAGRFALYGLAGELATEYGLTGWEQGAALDAAAEGFKVWRANRGKGNDERRQILEQVSSFIERHGDSRFSDADISPDSKFPNQTRDRAGWWRDSSAGRTYLFTKDGLREALKGFDFNRALDVLQAEGVLPAPGANGERAKSVRIKARGEETIRLYTVNVKKHEPDEPAVK